MTEKLKQMAPEILEAIKKADRVLINLHVNPDEDSAGSALSMKQAVEQLGKVADVMEGDSELPKGFRNLPGADKIIKKDFFEIDLSQYDLFLILDTGGLDQITKKGEATFPESLNTVVIDHHSSNPGYGKINLVEPNYPATSHMLFDLFNLWGIKINKEMASLLYLGIYGDTGGARYSNVSKDSLMAMAELAELDPLFWQHISQVENSKNPKSLEFRGLALLSVESYFSGKIPISAVSYDEIHLRGIAREDIGTGYVGNELLSVLEWEMGAVLVESFPEHTSLSLRSKNTDKFDVSKIATLLGGGGHKAAAGALIREPIEKAKKTLLEAIKKTYPELGVE